MANHPHLRVSIPRELLEEVNNLQYGDHLDDKIRISLAIRLYVDKTISMDQAAKLSGKSPVAFIDILHAHNVPGMEYRVKMLKKQMKRK